MVIVVASIPNLLSGIFYNDFNNKEYPGKCIIYTNNLFILFLMLKCVNISSRIYLDIL